MIAVEVLENPSVAAVALDPIRSRLLSELAHPASAATLAKRVGLTRQKVNYHLTALSARGLIREAETRQWGGLTERLMIASAASYVVSPSALGPIAVDPAREKDRLSASYAIAIAARVVREVGGLLKGALAAKKPLATLSIDAEIRFASAAARAAFTEELTAIVASLAARYHDEQAPGGRPHRLTIVAHPIPKTPDSVTEAEEKSQCP